MLHPEYYDIYRILFPFHSLLEEQKKTKLGGWKVMEYQELDASVRTSGAGIRNKTWFVRILGDSYTTGKLTACKDILTNL